MSTPRRRRRSRRVREYGTGTLVLVAAVSVLAAYRDRLVMAVVIAALGGSIATAGLYAAHLRTRAATARRKARPETRPEPQHKAPKRTPARANGLYPPEPRMITVTAECAGGQCLMCAAPGQCECACGHNPSAIMARNQADYDAVAASVNGGAKRVPHDLPPF